MAIGQRLGEVRSFGQLGYLYSEAADWRRTQIGHAHSPSIEERSILPPLDEGGYGRCAYLIRVAANEALDIRTDLLALVKSGRKNAIVLYLPDDQDVAIRDAEEWSGGSFEPTPPQASQIERMLP
jgi:hypothetical protein